MKKAFMLLFLLAASLCVWSQTTEGVIVRSGDSEQQFVISAIKEITFGDEGMTIVMTDEAAVLFSGNWQISFGEVVATSILHAGGLGDDEQIKVFGADGQLVKELDRRADFSVSDLPKGVYLIKSNGKSLKIYK